MRITVNSLPFLAIGVVFLVISLWLVYGEGNHDELVVGFAIGATICVRFSGVFDADERGYCRPVAKGKCSCSTDHASQDFINKSGEANTVCWRCEVAPPITPGGICRECAYREALTETQRKVGSTPCPRCGAEYPIEVGGVCQVCALKQGLGNGGIM